MFFSRTLFCSLRPQVLTEIGSVLFDRRSQRNSVPFPSSARSKQNSVLSRSAESQQNSVLFSWAAASQRGSVLFTPDSCISTEPGSVHPGQLHPNGTRFCSPGRLVLNGTQFCFPGQLHLNGTRFCSPGRPILNGTQFRSRAAASQRNPVLFTPDSCISTQLGSVPLDGRFSTELGSVHPGWLVLNGTQFCSPRMAASQRNPVLFTQMAGSQRNSVPLHPGRLHLNGTRFCSPRLPSPNGTQFRSRAAASQRNSVPFPGSYITTELGSVPGQLHHNGTRFCSPGQPRQLSRSMSQ